MLDMSIVSDCDVEDADPSQNGLDAAALIQLKIQQAQDLILQMNYELSSIVETIEFKKLDRDRKQNRLWVLRWQERYQFLRHGNTWKNVRWFVTLKNTFDEGSYKQHVQPTIREQDDLIKNLRYKLLHESNCLAREKKLIKHIKKAEEVRETLVANYKPGQSPHTNAREINNMEVYRARQQKMKDEQKVVDDLESANKELRSLQEVRIQMNKKRNEVHRIIYDLVKQQGQVPASHPVSQNCTFNYKYQI